MRPVCRSTGLVSNSQSWDSGLMDRHGSPPAAPPRCCGPAAEHAPAYPSIADGLRLLVTDRRIPLGTRLPSERELTVALGVSRTTVTRAYAHLQGRRATSPPGRARAASCSCPRAPAPATCSSTRGRVERGADDRPDLRRPDRPAGVTAAYERRGRAAARPPAGVRLLPRPGCPHCARPSPGRYAERGLPTDPGPGAGDLRRPVGAGDRESAPSSARRPGADGEPDLSERDRDPARRGARVVGADIDQRGWATSSLVDAVRQVRPRSAYLMPDFHNPTGLLMTDEQREQLAAALRRRAHARGGRRDDGRDWRSTSGTERCRCRSRPTCRTS